MIQEQIYTQGVKAFSVNGEKTLSKDTNWKYSTYTNESQTVSFFCCLFFWPLFNSDNSVLNKFNLTWLHEPIIARMAWFLQKEFLAQERLQKTLSPEAPEQWKAEDKLLNPGN